MIIKLQGKVVSIQREYITFMPELCSGKKKLISIYVTGNFLNILIEIDKSKNKMD